MIMHAITWKSFILMIKILGEQDVFVKHYAHGGNEVKNILAQGPQVIELGVWCHWKGHHWWRMHAKYTTIISYSSVVIANARIDNTQTNRTDGSDNAPIYRWEGNENSGSILKNACVACETKLCVNTKKVWQPDGQTDAGQSDPYVPLCFAGDTKTLYQQKRLLTRAPQSGAFIPSHCGQADNDHRLNDEKSSHMNTLCKVSSHLAKRVICVKP